MVKAKTMFTETNFGYQTLMDWASKWFSINTEENNEVLKGIQKSKDKIMV